MRSLTVRLFLASLILVGIPVFAHDVTVSGTQSFASLDGSASDHDGSVNGVFTVNDGNLTVNGVVNCNDDVATSACAMAFNVSGNMTIATGGALYAENRSGGGTGGAITLTVGGNLALDGDAVVSSASKTSSGAMGGAITANVSGNVTQSAASRIDSGSANAAGGAIAIVAGGLVTVGGNVLSGPSSTFLSTRLYGGPALDGGTANNAGGAITITSSTFAEPAITIASTASIVSQGADNGAGPVTIEGCGVKVFGLVAALARKASPAQVSIRSGKDVLIDGRDLGATGTRMGRVRADAPSGTAQNKGVDVFAAETIDIHGPATGLFVITSVPGLHDSKSYGGLIRITSTGDAVNGSGNMIDDGHTASGDSGGTVEIAAKEDVTLNTAVIRAFGDFNTNNGNRGGGTIRVRSYSGDVLWTNGTGDVRPVGSTSGLPLADQGSIVLTACGTVDTTGSSFPVMGTATSVFPETHTGVCSPAAPSLPSGVAPLGACNTPPVANDASATTNEDTTVTITLSGTDADGDSLTFSIVSGPLNGTLGPIVPTGPTTATVNYTPNLNFNGADAFVYQANDGNGGTDNATVTITVNAVNDPPSFLAGPTVSVLEDSGPQTYANWATSISAGPADESGQTVTFTVTNDNNALFAVQPALSSNGTLTFTPATNATGSATITVVAQDNGGTANGGNDTSAAQTSSITVNAVNDEPSFTAGANQTVYEDAGAQSVAGWATGISAGPNEGSQTVSFVLSNDNNALFSAQPAVSSSGTLTYTPAANANGTATVTIYAQDNGGTANGGDDTSASQTFTITVNAVNDAPSFTSGGNVTVLEDSGAYTAAWATSISAGPADESGQTVSFSASNDNNALFAAQPAIDASGNLTFTTAANASGSATVTVTLSDNGGTANGGADTSAPQTFTITINVVNDEPSFTAGGNVTVNEDSGAYSAAWASAISAGPNEGSQTVTFVVANDNNSLFSSQPAISASGVLTFTPAANANGSATVTVYLTDDGGTANGGDDTSASVTFTITVNAVNDAPSFVSGGDVSVNEDSGAYSAAWATSISAGPANESGQAFTFNITGNSNPSLFATGPSISASGVLSFTLAANAFGSATLTVTLSDDGGTANGGVDTSAAQTFTITVNGVNDAPSFVSGGDVAVNEDSGAYSAGWAASISAGPGESGQTVTFAASNNNNALFSVQPSISSTGVLTFTPAPNAFGSATVSVYAQDNGGTANGGVDTSATVTFTITVNSVNDPPVAGNDSWETEGNTELRVDTGSSATPHVADTTPSGKGVADNDSDPVEGDPVTVTGVVGCADITAPYDCAVTGGNVSLNANGSFSFKPSAGATAASFQYTITDGTDTATGSVTFTIHDMIWYVNGSAAPGGDGTSSAPFTNFASLSGFGGAGDVDGAGDYIFVHTSAVTGSSILEPSQKLWGQGIGLIIPRNLNGNGSPTVLVAPGTRPTVTAVAGHTVLITSVTGVEVAGLSIVSPSGNGIDLTSAATAASATIYSNGVTATAGQGINIDANSAAGTTASINTTDIVAMGDGVNLLATAGNVIFSFSNASVTSMTGSGIVANGAAATSFVVTGMANITIGAGTPGQGISVTGGRFDSNAGTAAFDTVNAGNWTVATNASPAGGNAVVLTNVSGDLAWGTLNAYGTTGGVSVTGTGLFTGAAGMRVSNSGGNARASAGAGLSVTNATIGAGNLNFTSINAAGGVNGILLDNTGTAGGLNVTGTGTAGSGGTIQNTTGDAVRLANAVNVSLNRMNLTNSAAGVTNAVTCNFSNAGGCQAAVDMSSVSNVSLDNVVIDHNNAGQAGISGVGINGLSVTNSQILEVGDADAESAVLLQNASGTVLLQDVLIDAPEEYGVRVFQTTGSLSMTLRRVTVQNNIGTFGEAGASWRIEGGSATVLVDDSDFLNTDGPAVDGQATLSGTLNLTLTGNTMNENRALPHGINFVTSGTASGRLTATSNILTGCAVASNCSQGIDLDAAGSSSLDAIITGNTLTNTGIGTGLEFIVNDNAVGRAEIRTNNITVNPNRLGMNFLARAVTIAGATGQLHVTIGTNTVNGINASFIPGLQFAAGASTGTHATTVCANVSTLNGSGNNAVNGTAAPDVYAFTLRQRTGTNFQLQGFTGTGTNPASVENFVQTNNSGGTLAGATEVFAASGSTIVNYSSATCQTPSAAPLP